LIDVELADEDSLLSHLSGIISTAQSGNDILFVADDVDFRAGYGTISNC